jgi:hypothetical protein
MTKFRLCALWFVLGIAACDPQAQYDTAIKLAYDFAAKLGGEHWSVIACVQRYAGPVYECTVLLDDTALGVRCNVERRGCFLVGNAP